MNWSSGPVRHIRHDSMTFKRYTLISIETKNIYYHYLKGFSKSSSFHPLFFIAMLRFCETLGVTEMQLVTW